MITREAAAAANCAHVWDAAQAITDKETARAAFMLAIGYDVFEDEPETTVDDARVILSDWLDAAVWMPEPAFTTPVMTCLEILTSLGFEREHTGGNCFIHVKRIGTFAIFVGNDEGGEMQEGDTLFSYSVWEGDDDTTDWGDHMLMTNLRIELEKLIARYEAKTAGKGWTKKDLAEIVRAVAGTKAGGRNWPGVDALPQDQLLEAIDGCETIPDALEAAYGRAVALGLAN